jgi:S-adenosylmethionine hydrolase
VGVVHAVIARVAPDVRVIDLTHGIRRQDVTHGALVLERALGYAPAGVHVAVVDPGVGAGRRAVVLRTAEEGRLLVGPDNGLLMPAAARFGGVAEAMEISASPWRLEPVSATFHGRDLFAPVAARLASGGALADAGEALDPAALVALELPWAEAAGATLRATVAGVDGFGNVSLYARGGDAGTLGTDGRLVVRTAGGELPARMGHTFADVAPGDLLVHEDAAGLLAIARNQGDAAAALGVGPGDRVEVAPA